MTENGTYKARMVPAWLSRLVLFTALGLMVYIGIRWLLPIYRVRSHSELVMVGDFNNDRRWDGKDRERLQSILAEPYRHSPLECVKVDVNNDGRLDAEDLDILEQLFDMGDPYTAEAKAIEARRSFPRPRELYRYLSDQEYLNRPLFSLNYAAASNSPLDCLRKGGFAPGEGPYVQQLWAEIYDEAVRFDLAYRMRLSGLTETEREYAQKTMDGCNQLYAEGRNYDLLLELIGLTEDAETLTTRGQDQFVAQTLFFRDHLRDLLVSPKYADFQSGRIPAQEILTEIDRLLKHDLDVDIALDQLGPPRDFKQMKNYVSRTEWQYYKSRSRTRQFEELIHFAQHDRRYLRAVSRTSRKHSDFGVQNHNLPMILLFREAIRIAGNKKSAVGLLDESIRIPFFWVKSIPREKLPSSLAFENFLLPGNKEDGGDKSRHWNVFGGICLYQSPRESLGLALKREMQDLRNDHFSAKAMTEFIRDSIANLSGIYYVISMDPELLNRSGGHQGEAGLLTSHSE